MSAAPKLNKVSIADQFENVYTLFPEHLSHFRLYWQIFSDKIPELSEKDEDLLHQVKNIRTTPRDNRFPSTNQALHCWNRYNEWLLCLKETGKNEEKCQVYRQYALSICPGDWTANWDEAREEGSFAGLKV